jgi:hypothetical protein
METSTVVAGPDLGMLGRERMSLDVGEAAEDRSKRNAGALRNRHGYSKGNRESDYLTI